MNDFSSEDICKIAEMAGIGRVDPNWSGIDAVLPLLEMIRQDGAVLIIKFDGGRANSEDEPGYTVLVSDGPLGDDFIRRDTPSIEEGLTYLIAEYAARVWQ